MKVVYIADDGAQFEDEDECKEYEYVNQMKGKFPTTRFFNRECQAVPFLATCEFCESLFYVEVNDFEEANRLHEWFNDCGFDSIWRRDFKKGRNITLGRFFYDTKEDGWRNVDELYNAYKSVEEVFTRGC